MPSAFSRVQLAAALLEYDNDVSNPMAPYRSAHESAIFAHLRRNDNVHPPLRSRRSTDYLGVSLPSEGGSVSGRESALAKSHKKSGSSIHALRNPFGGDVAAEEEEEPEKEGLEVDLASWGLDAFMPKDKAAKNAAKLKAKADKLPNPHPVTSLRQNSAGSVVEPRRRMTSRSLSMGNFDSFGDGGAFLDAPSSVAPRPRSVGDVLDQNDIDPALFQRRRASSHVLIETIASAASLHSIPFPTSGSPLPDDSASRPESRGSGYLLDTKRPPHNRTYSSNSLGSRRLLDESEDSTFAVRPPSPDRASLFDPKVNHVRNLSTATMGTMASRNLLVDEDNPFTIRPPSPSRSSRFDPKMAAHARTVSNASMGSRMLLDNDGMSMLGGQSMLSGQPLQTQDRPYSTIELLRPKVLVMPSPLQSTYAPKESELSKAREGFHLSTDGPPLPPGARSARPISGSYDASPVASHLFTPNPRLSLTLSQLAFRNTLLVGGERDVAYSDIDRGLPRATEEGQQMQILIEQPEDVEAVPQPISSEEPIQLGRPAGKLFGKSLIDDLENRKASMRSKQRVFTGDARPSMMARGQLQRTSTLIDPESLQRPLSVGPHSPLGRSNSANIRPLLNFDDNKPGNRTTLLPNPRAQGSRSVFGTDTLWEREMAKLKEMEAADQLAKEEKEKRDSEETARLERKKKKKAKGKSKAKAPAVVEEDDTELGVISEPGPRVSAEPPVLPVIPKSNVRGPPPPVNDEDTESESDGSAPQAPAQRKARRGSAETAADRWVAGSSDEDDGPRKTPGVGLRYPKQARGKSQFADDDSEEDLPLAATVGRALQRAMSSGGDDSDEDMPLSSMLGKGKLNIPPISLDSLSSGKPKPNDEDDDQPLGLRASRITTSSSYVGGNEDEDDKPLALHPDQQRRAQYMAMAQQQQMMAQAQMHQSMFFGTPSMMGSGFFGPQMAPMPSPMMMGPLMLTQPMSSPPPVQDVVKLGRVDRWRHDVAVEGQP